MEEHRPLIIPAWIRFFSTGREFTEEELLGIVEFAIKIFLQTHINIHFQVLQAKGVCHGREEISKVEPLPF